MVKIYFKKGESQGWGNKKLSLYQGMTGLSIGRGVSNGDACGDRGLMLR
jgi:hypothetical protein